MRRTRATLLAVLASLLGLVATAVPVNASGVVWTYYSTSGGTRANLIGTLVTSDLTGASTLGDTTWPRSASNAVASVSVPGIISVGAVTSNQDAVAYGDGVQVTSKAKVAGISLLGGAIHADALETTAWARASSAGFARGGDSQLLNLVVGDHAISASTAPNTTISIPGLAQVTINGQKTAQDSAAIVNQGFSLQVKLLADYGGAKVGSTITITPASVTIVSGSPSVATPVGGFAYGTAVLAAAGDVQTKLGATALLQIPAYGTGGKTYTNSTASANLPGVVDLGVLQSEVNATTVPGFADVSDGAQTAAVNVLNGFITADAVKVKSHVQKTTSSHLEEQSTELVNLKIAGKSYPINAAPNTSINIAGLGLVVLNQQYSKPGYSVVVGLRVIIGTNKLGYPVGTDIQVSVASTWIGG